MLSPFSRVANNQRVRAFKLGAAPPVRQYLSVPLQTPAGYTPNDVSPGDLDGDGEYELVVHQVGRGRDNSQPGLTTEPILEAYKLDGTRLWRINLGRNIREGAHYTQFMVYDLDGDGKAEVACKTADGTIDGKGKVIGDAKADYRQPEGATIDIKNSQRSRAETRRKRICSGGTGIPDDLRWPNRRGARHDKLCSSSSSNETESHGR